MPPTDANFGIGTLALGKRQPQSETHKDHPGDRIDPAPSAVVASHHPGPTERRRNSAVPRGRNRDHQGDDDRTIAPRTLCRQGRRE